MAVTEKSKLVNYESSSLKTVSENEQNLDSPKTLAEQISPEIKRQIASFIEVIAEIRLKKSGRE